MALSRARQSAGLCRPIWEMGLVLPEQLQWWEGTRGSCMRDYVPGYHASRRLAAVAL